MSAVELVTSAAAFWKQTGAVYKAENPSEPGGKGRTRQALSNKFTWLFVFFMFGYCGLEGMLPILVAVKRLDSTLSNYLEQLLSVAGLLSS